MSRPPLRSSVADASASGSPLWSRQWGGADYWRSLYLRHQLVVSERDGHARVATLRGPLIDHDPKVGEGGPTDLDARPPENPHRICVGHPFFQLQVVSHGAVSSPVGSC